MRGIVCWVLLVCCVATNLAQSKQEDIYGRLVDSVYYNLDEGDPHDNETIILRAVESNYFDGLSCLQQGKLYHLLGVSRYMLNMEYEAIGAFSKVIHQYWRNCDEVPDVEVANTLYNIGISYQYTPDAREGAPYIERSLNLLERTPDVDSFDLAFKYMGAAVYFDEQDDFVRAETGYKRVAYMLDQLGIDPIDKLANLNGLLTLYLKYKKLNRGNDTFAKIQQLLKSSQLHDQDQEVLISYLNGAELAVHQQRYRFASELLEKIFTQADIPDDFLSNAYEINGFIKKGQGNYREAKLQFLKSAELRVDSTDIFHQNEALSFALENISEMMWLRGRQDEAFRLIDSAMQLLVPAMVFDEHGYPIIKTNQISNKRDLIRQLEIKAKFLANGPTTPQDQLITCLQAYYKIDTLVNQALSSIAFERSKLKLMELVNRGYQSAVELIVKNDFPTPSAKNLEHLSYFISRSKAVVLQKELEDSRRFNSIQDQSIRRAEDSLKIKIADVQKAMLNNPLEHDSLRQFMHTYQNQLNAFYKTVDELNPTYARQKKAFIAPPSVADMQRHLHKQAALVNYFSWSDSTLAIWINKEKTFVTLHHIDSEILNRFLSYLKDPNRKDHNGDAMTLYSQLLASGERQLDDFPKYFYIIPHEELLYLPFETLSPDTDGSRLIEYAAVQYAYTTSMLFSHGESDYKTYGGFGTAYSDQLNNRLKQQGYLNDSMFLAPLRTSSDEIKDAAELFESEYFLEDDAQLATFLTKANEYDIVHLSLHGLVDYDDPNRACIIFDDKQDDYLLTPYDLFAHPLDANLTILSACHSAGGGLFQGEGVFGMTRSFLSAGSKNVLSSLWSATENSSINIIPGFLEKLKGHGNTASALQQAKLTYLSNESPYYRHPYFWANFVVIGNMQFFEADSTRWIKSVSLAACALLLLFLLLRINSRK